MFRLHIDMPLGTNEEDALRVSKEIIEAIDIQKLLSLHSDSVDTEKVFQYRVSNDTDRQIRNYLSKNENGHVSTKKCKVEYIKGC